jgi:PAS domain S-box-containing protein
MAQNPPSLGFQKLIVLPVGLALVAVVALFLAGFLNYLDWRDAERTEQTVSQVEQTWQRLLRESTRQLEHFTHQAALDPGLATAMRRRDGAALLALTKPTYDELHRRFGISHWYFIAPDRRIVLRVHDPANVGDLIQRKTLLAAQTRGQPVTGLELGATATMTLRHVQPWYAGGELIGYLEMGTEVGWFDQLIKDMLGVEVLSAVHKEFTSEANFARGKRALGFSGLWPDHDGIAILNQTLAPPAALIPAWQSFAASGPGRVIDFKEAGQAWSTGFLLLKDIADRPVASLAILRPMNAALASRNRLTALVVGGAALLTAALIAALVLRVRRIERQTLAAEAAVRENEQRFRDFASAASDWWFWETDPELRFTYLSESAGKVVGRPLDSMLGKRRDELAATAASPDEQAAWQAYRDTIARREPFLQYEYRIALPDGGWRWLSVSGVPRFGEDGAFLGYRGTGANITERKAREEAEGHVREGTEIKLAVARALQEVDRPFAARIDTALAALARMRCVLPEGGARLELPHEESGGHAFHTGEAMWRTDLPDLAVGEVRVVGHCQVRSDPAHGHYFLPLAHGDQRLGVLELDTRPNPPEHPARLESLRQIGEIFALGVINERTARLYREAAAQAAAANQAKSQFLATMSHEIRTPLNGILGMAQLMLEPDLSEPERLDYAETILASGQTLLTILNDILDFSKIEADKLELAYAPFMPASLVGGIAMLFREAAGRKRLALATAWQGPEGQAYQGDEVRLRQMLANLINNAIKFTERGEIRVEAREVTRQGEIARLRFSIVDTGIGIAQDQLARLFQPFSQVDGSNTRSYGGTGLGLSIVRKLAELMGGQAGVASEAGAGSTFWFEIEARLVDLAAPDASDFARAETVASAPDSGPANILVVEDNATNRQVIKAMLGKLGHVVAMAEDGRLAVAAIQQGATPDLILMDLQMPELNGIDATRQIRAWEREQGRARIPIVALTASAFPEDRDGCIEAGMDDYLAKPVQMARLKTALSHWLDQPRAESGSIQL